MKGIGIMAVIAGHTNPDYITGQIISSFHMPLFFIIAGYLYKPTDLFWTKFKNDFRRLVIPYITTSLLIGIALLFISRYYYASMVFLVKAMYFATTEDHTSMIWAHVPKIGPIWFLLALFWCRTNYNFINYCVPSYKSFIVIFISIIAVIIDRYIINFPFSLLPGLSAMIFYLIGEHIRHNGISKSVISICALCWIIHLFFSRIDMCICMYKLYPIDICGAIFGTTATYQISKLFLRYKALSKVFSFFGRTSLILLCAHTFEWSILNINQRLDHYIWIYKFMIEAIICIILTYLWLCIKKNGKLPLTHK